MTESPLSPLEVATGAPVGPAAVPPEPWPAAPRSPREALDAAIRPALLQPPCVVSFSGGRDSALLLAAAAELARREGHAPPVAVTLRFPGDALAEESAWQERAIAAMAPVEWLRHEVAGGELDLLGPAATALLLRHGLRWPFNVHFHAPVLPHARGGTVLVGFDGDGLLDGWRWARTAAMLRRGAARAPRDVAVAGLALAPRPLRAAVLLRRDTEPLPWLTARAADADRRGWAAELAGEPRTWPARVAWLGRRRYVALARESFALAAADAGATVAFPLLDAGVLAALARAGGRRGYADRTTALRRAFGGLLPPDLEARRDKASFDHAFWGARSRAAIDAWDGTGVDERIVSVEGLRQEWARELPHAGTAQLLQQVWLASAQAAQQRDDGGQGGEVAGPVQDERRERDELQ